MTRTWEHIFVSKYCCFLSCWIRGLSSFPVSQSVKWLQLLIRQTHCPWRRRTNVLFSAEAIFLPETFLYNWTRTQTPLAGQCTWLFIFQTLRAAHGCCRHEYTELAQNIQVLYGQNCCKPLYLQRRWYWALLLWLLTDNGMINVKRQNNYVILFIYDDVVLWHSNKELQIQTKSLWAQ